MMSKTLDTIQKAYRMDETECLSSLVEKARLPQESLNHIHDIAENLVIKVRETRLKSGGLDAFLSAYDLSSEEGIALMCLAEALLRIPDSDTIDRLIKDKITSLDWDQHLGKSHSLFVNAATWALMLTGKVLQNKERDPKTLMNTLRRFVSRTGEPIIRQAVSQAMKILGRQFVMGETIQEALVRARKREAIGYRYSYDMLGEAAKTMEDAEKYYQAYASAIKAIGEASKNQDPISGPGVSVKLSALHPRYEWVNRDRMQKELLPKLMELVLLSKQYNIGFTIDAEEADRLELSLLLIESIVADPRLEDWQGFGMAVQAYQKRGIYVVDWLINLAKQHNRRLMIRLVKGAYWDSEIKWTQEKGLKSYPVFTRKSSTDVSYIACAKKLIEAGDIIYPQFATHNAYTVAVILELTKNKNNQKLTGNDNELRNKDSVSINTHNGFEFQCLHGMGDTLYNNIVPKEEMNIPCRIYAPVGGHEYLLAYLVRRLLENGANTSFVNRIIDEQVPIDDILQDPVLKTIKLDEKPHPKIPLPRNLYKKDGKGRENSMGLDLSNPLETQPVLEEISVFSINISESLLKKNKTLATPSDVETAIVKATEAAKLWNRSSIEERATLLDKLGHLIEKNRSELITLLVREGGKSVMDSISEVREATDFCWYFANQIRKEFQTLVLPGPTGEHNQLSLHGRGVMACISPWNFPLAIFLGQVTAALASGNTVISKPASQTPMIAQRAIELCHEAGFSKEVVQCLIGGGREVGQPLMEDNRINGVLFTGSTETGRGINQTLAARSGPIVPFIAETGGQNAMIVDSTALAEQVVQDVIISAFNSAGQRCSALRVLFLQEEIADSIITMLKGAMAELKIGDPFELSTDVGPVIDQNAATTLENHAVKMAQQYKLIYQCQLPQQLPNLPRGVFFAPRAFEIPDISVLTQEVFGPILHIVRYSSKNLDQVLDSINNTGYGLTLGIHSRISDTVDYIHERLRVGNTYVNRNMIGAVVGVQPFGGEGLSGTGPKTGGPHILPRLAIERTLSINIAASGGNPALMSLSED